MPQNRNDVLKKLEAQAESSLHEWLSRAMGWRKNPQISVSAKSEVMPSGTWKATAMGEIDLLTVSQDKKMARNIETLSRRHMLSCILEYFAGKDNSFVFQIPDDADEESVQTAVIFHYTDAYGEDEFEKASDWIRKKAPDIHCYAMFSIEYYPRELVMKGICGPNGQTMKMGSGMATDSPLLYEKDNGGYERTSIWIKDFVRGKAGDLSKNYVIRQNSARK